MLRFTWQATRLLLSVCSLVSGWKHSLSKAASNAAVRSSSSSGEARNSQDVAPSCRWDSSMLCRKWSASPSAQSWTLPGSDTPSACRVTDQLSSITADVRGQQSLAEHLEQSLVLQRMLGKACRMPLGRNSVLLAGTTSTTALRAVHM